jgi:hypothetical protein
VKPYHSLEERTWPSSRPYPRRGLASKSSSRGVEWGPSNKSGATSELDSDCRNLAMDGNFGMGQFGHGRGAPQCEPCPDSMLEMPGEGHGFIAVNFPNCEENPWDKKCRDMSTPPVPGSRRGTLNNLRSIARVGRLFPVPRSQLAVTLARKS